MEKVSFIRIEDDPPDLILSFAIWQPELDDIRSLILMRTPQYEFIFNEAEHGVKVSDEAWLNDEDEILKEIEFDGDAVTIVTESHKFELCRNSGRNSGGIPGTQYLIPLTTLCSRPRSRAAA